MRRIVLVGAALVASTLATSLPASARMGMAPLASPNSEIVQVKHGHGHAHRGGRGHHYGWSRGRGHHYGWRHRRR